MGSYLPSPFRRAAGFVGRNDGTRGSAHHSPCPHLCPSSIRKDVIEVAHLRAEHWLSGSTAKRLRSRISEARWATPSPTRSCGRCRSAGSAGMTKNSYPRPVWPPSGTGTGSDLAHQSTFSGKEAGPDGEESTTAAPIETWFAVEGNDMGKYLDILNAAERDRSDISDISREGRRSPLWSLWSPWSRPKEFPRAFNALERRCPEHRARALATGDRRRTAFLLNGANKLPLWAGPLEIYSAWLKFLTSQDQSINGCPDTTRLV